MTERMGLAAVGRQNRQRAALARRAELRPAARRLAAVAVGFAGGWAVLYGALMPFGLGLVLGFAEDCFAPCAAGAALGMLLHGFGALSLRSVCMLCALGAAVAARWMGARTLTPAALAGCGTLTIWLGAWDGRRSLRHHAATAPPMSQKLPGLPST